MASRLVNARTKKESGFDYVIGSINAVTPFGCKLLREMKPFLPGSEDALEDEFNRVERIYGYVKEQKTTVDRIDEIFMCMKDISFTVKRAKNNSLSQVELFDIKELLLSMERLSKIYNSWQQYIPHEYMLRETVKLLDVMDPRGDRTGTFYIYDEFSPALGGFRKAKRECELALRKVNRDRAKELKDKYGIILTPAFDCVVSKADTEKIKMIKETAGLKQIGEDTSSLTFAPEITDKVQSLTEEAEKLQALIEEEETAVREKLSLQISEYEIVLLENMRRIGEMDVALAKGRYAVKHNCVRPEIADVHVAEIREGRHLQVEDILSRKGKNYQPVSVCLRNGVTCITGANMGGKTVSMKMVAQIALLAQYGFFVPCEYAKLGLSAYMQMLIGDNQSVVRGLSGFGSEIEELKEMLDHGKDRSMIFIDEIGNGTNPSEGTALTRSLIDYLSRRPYISLITTHFDVMGETCKAKNMRVRGLENSDFDKLDREIRYANRRERIEIIGKYMDYRLYNAGRDALIPQDAIKIAGMLGIEREIIDKAKKYLDKEYKGGTGKYEE